MSTSTKIAINCSNCRSQLVLPPEYKFPIVCCDKCYSLTRIFNPGLPFLGGAKAYYCTPSNPPKCPTPCPKAKKAYHPTRPALSPKAKKAYPPKSPAPSPQANPPKPPSLEAKKADPPKPPSLKAKKADLPKPPSPSLKAKEAYSRKKEDDNPGIQKNQIGVGGSQVNGNKGDQNRKFLDGNKTENFHFHVSKIILQLGRDHEETEILQRGWDDAETESDRETESDGKTETTDAETESTDEETETTDGETETTDWETETDGETETYRETKIYGETKTKYIVLF